MPEVMRLNKLGSFSMAQLGQSKSIIGDLIKKKKESDGASFQDSMSVSYTHLTLPTMFEV